MMNNNRMLGPWVQRFFEEYLVAERNVALNTWKSYLSTLKLFVPFLCAKLGKADYKLAVQDVTSELVLQFLSHLEDDRDCSIQTRNQRLTAVRAFARFVGSREPTHIAWSGRIRSIASKKANPQPIVSLSKVEADAMLDVPDRTTERGRIEYALLHFLRQVGARVSEATDLRVSDVQAGRRDGRHALVTLHGKGGKIRQCPLLRDTERALADLVNGREPSEAVFLSRYGKAYTRFGVYRLVERCASKVPALVGRRITPHVLRHTAACELVRARVDINTIRALLGHASLDTTNVYAEIDLEAKAKALALCDIAEPGPSRPWKEDKGIMAFLKSL